MENGAATVEDLSGSVATRLFQERVLFVFVGVEWSEEV